MTQFEPIVTLRLEIVVERIITPMLVTSKYLHGRYLQLVRQLV